MKYPIPFDERELSLKSITMRRDIVTEVHTAGSGHPGGALSATDLFVVLYNCILRHDSDNPIWADRDRFILSKAHISPGYYSILARTGYFSPNELTSFRSFGHFLQGHPKMDLEHGIEIGGGSLGQNLSVAVGTALGLKKRGIPSRVFDMSSEGELQEGSMWESIMAASQFKLNNLCCIVDYNRLQIDGKTEDVMEVAPLDKKFESFNWNAIYLENGHDIKAIYEAFKKFNLLSHGKPVPDMPNLDPTKPTAIIARTVKGKGVSFMEENAAWHGRAPNNDEFALALKELEEAESKLNS